MINIGRLAGIRSNAVNADRIRTGLLPPDMVRERAAARGLDPDAYFKSNLLKKEVTADDVASAFVSLALAESTPAGVAECRRLDHEIEHYEKLVDRATQIDSAVWQQRIGDHLAILYARREEGCPGYGTEEQIAAQFTQLVKLVGKAALSYLTLGAF